MASKAKKTTVEDAPLIDLNDSALKKLITKAKKRGYITIDEINEAVPSDQNEQIEDLMSSISDMGVACDGDDDDKF